MKLRPATKDDINIYYNLYAEVQNMHAEALPNLFDPPKQDRHFQAYFDKIIKNENRHLMLGFHEDRPVGYIYYVFGKIQEDKKRAEERFIYINQIAVTPQYQGRGFGKALMNHVKQTAKDQNIKRIGLDVWLFNKPAMSFFEHQGFAALNQIMWYTNR